MVEHADASAPTIVSFGPYRVIGMREAGAGGPNAFGALWHAFIPRIAEVRRQKGADFSVGLCRCLPDAGDGGFEYIAVIPAAVDAPIPDGMIDTRIAKATYVVFPVAGLDAIMKTWEAIGAWMEAHPAWDGYCTPAVCQCATHPGFELYPSAFPEDQQLYIYVPVRRAGS
jgi:predicted transcriptional regulator YdeE